MKHILCLVMAFVTATFFEQNIQAQSMNEWDKPSIGSVEISWGIICYLS